MNEMRWLLAIVGSVFLNGVPAPAETRSELSIEFWYGDQQNFGHNGHPQRWINILGHASPGDSIASLNFRLNDGDVRPLSFRAAPTRIARTGDFNIEIARSNLRPGANTVTVVATDHTGVGTKSVARFNYVDGRRWQIPYTIDWSEAQSIQDVAQIVDGKWQLTADGIRSVERHYDRVIAFGDHTWKDYEVTTTVTVHKLTAPKVPPNRTNVTHAAIALRWPGHDKDGKQPSIKWHPVGATAEFRLGSDLSQCRWRIFDGKKGFRVESERRRTIEFGKPYRMKHRVETMPDGQSRYQAKLWSAAALEPTAWDIERTEPNDLKSGSALLIAHFSDVTFGNVQVTPIRHPR